MNTKMGRARRGEPERIEGGEAWGERGPAASSRRRRLRVDGGGGVPATGSPNEEDAGVARAMGVTEVPAAEAATAHGGDDARLKAAAASSVRDELWRNETAKAKFDRGFGLGGLNRAERGGAGSRMRGGRFR
ncbi:hypothetical protein GUJ93_ZPchr0013g34925 [Zizania palustris]|uniref:Uncharacterized protein n=1 Tax=Zizania palustris TaxID=103762 RepID=A0A8J5WV20_ZIZPA|nr:hypothetical protein GUJ93_ZPchr0013g34925 [Zizania palustris]